MVNSFLLAIKGLLLDLVIIIPCCYELFYRGLMVNSFLLAIKGLLLDLVIIIPCCCELCHYICCFQQLRPFSGDTTSLPAVPSEPAVSDPSPPAPPLSARCVCGGFI